MSNRIIPITIVETGEEIQVIKVKENPGPNNIGCLGCVLDDYSNTCFAKNEKGSFKNLCTKKVFGVIKSFIFIKV